DLQQERLYKLTDDPYADLQPAWSPDGKSIAFVTDRFTTDLKTLAYHSYRLALFNTTTKRIQPLTAQEGPKGGGDAKQIDPQWSRDSRAIYYVSDATGISNLYRLDVESGAITQITSITTGISGITQLSPAISMATGTGKLLFSAYRKRK